jgi:hypothetical protein
LWWSLLLVEDTVVPGENHQPEASYWQTLSHKAVYQEKTTNLKPATDKLYHIKLYTRRKPPTGSQLLTNFIT